MIESGIERERDRDRDRDREKEYGRVNSKEEKGT